MRISANGYLKLLEGKPADAGSEAFMHSLLPYLKAHKHKVSSILINGAPKVESRTIRKDLSRNGMDFVTIKTYFGFKKIREATSHKFPDSIYKVIEIAKGVFAATETGFSSYQWIFNIKLGTSAGRCDIKLPIISVMHGLWFTELKASQNNLPLSKHGLALTKTMQKDVATYSNKLFFVSEFSKQAFEKNIVKLKKGKFEVIPLPYNTEFEKIPKLRHKSKLVKIGLVARWDPIKNHHAFLDLAKAATKLRLPWRFHSVTDFNRNKDLAEIKNQYRKLIKIHKSKPYPQLRKFYSEMDILILPSKFDVLGAVVMEAALQNRLTLISENVGWTHIYPEFGMKDLIVDFSKPAIAIKAITKHLHSSPPKQFVKYLKTVHSPKTIFNNFVRELEKTI